MKPAITDPRVIERFMKYIVKGASFDDCWGWKLSGRFKGGYGGFKLYGKTVASHQVSYRIFKGLIGEGQMVLHSCDNPICPNPLHLHLGSAEKNSQEMVERGRSLVGVKNHRAKFSLEDLQLIVNDARSNCEIAKDLGVSPSTIWKIKNGVSYALEVSA